MTTERCTCNDRPTTAFYCEVHHTFVDTIYLSEPAWNDFLENLNDPSEPNEALKAAAVHFKSKYGDTTKAAEGEHGVRIGLL